MKPLDFIAAVVPSAGVYCVAELSSRKKQHVYAQRVEDLEPIIEQFNAKNYDIYFALASFIEEGKRTAENALYMRSFFMDIDCGEGKAYLTKQAAVTALDEFLQATDLGKMGNPWIVSSGGGLHIYWPLNADVAISEWRLAAENLKRLCKKNDLHIDFTVTADAARVLRVPETRNWKNKTKPRPVKLMTTGGTFDFATFAEAVKTPLNGEAVLEGHFSPIPGKKPTRKNEGSRIELVKNSVTYFKNILVKTEAGTGCGQIAHYLTHAAEDGMEPLWRGLLSLAQKCDDGIKASRWLSKLHPYDDERMQQKLREIKGPYPCVKLDGENPGVCTSCVHWGKITNPLALGREIEVDNSEREIVLDQPVDLAAPSTDLPDQIKVTRPSPPRGFSYGKNGGVYREIETEDENKNKIKKQVLVLPFDMFVVDLLSVNREHHVFMLATRPEGPVQVIIPQKAVVSKDDTVKALASQNIIAAYGAGNDKNLFDYVRACVEHISTNKQAIPVPNSFGWQPDGSFVAGGKIFMPDNTVRQIPMPGLENLTHSTKPAGTLENWRKYSQMCIQRKLWDVLAVGCGVGFGSPLMEFTGLDGLTIHCCSTASGTGKSMALELAGSIWGHPRDYRVNKSTSPVAMQQHAGLLKNLPLLSDEITSKNRRDFEWFPEFVFDLSEGRGKDRMESGANKERLNTSVWALIAILSSNTHAMDYLSGARKHSSEGEIRRMLELKFNDKMVWELHEIEIIKSLRLNHAVAGDVYARWLSLNVDTAKAVYAQVYKKVRDEFSMTNDERYWHAGVSCMISGCILASSRYANVIDLPIEPLIAALKRMVENMRSMVRANVRTADDVLNAYIREFYGKFINVRAIDGAMQATFGETGIVDESITRTQVSGRVERGITPGYVNFFIEEQQLKSFCASMSYGYIDFRKELEALYRVDYVKKDMLSKTKGPQMRVNAVKISRPESSIIDPDDEDQGLLSVG